MNIEAHRTIDIFQTLKPEWNDLLRRSYADDIFLTWEWQSTWWDAYAPADAPTVLVCRDDSGQLMGIAPLFDVDGVYRIIGGEDVTDYLDLIVDATKSGAVLQAIVQYIGEQKMALDLLNIPAGSPTLTDFADCLRSNGAAVQVSEHEVCPLIELPDKWDGYLTLLDKKQRHEVRRKLRRAIGGEEDITWYTLDETHDLEDALARFMVLMAASDPEKADFLKDEQHVTFFKRFVRLAMANGWLQLNFLTVDGDDAAAYLNFDYNGRILVYNSGLALDDYSHLSPGIVLLAHNIKYAIENGYKVFDFLRGDEVYKYHMGGKDTVIYRLTTDS
ncbi:MAG: GNAT family N-acetyltransferase [Anaerolineaceae bacterium]|nr:MAG: GNAT family N-acetyltransferase [Anaerolineaceae bacterium]